MSKLFKACLLAATVALSLPAPVQACGGLFCSRVPVEQAGERILFATDGENVTCHVQIQYQGAAPDFSWILPVPTQPQVGVGSDALFQALRGSTQPRFEVEIDQTRGKCKEILMDSRMRGAVAGNAVPAPAAKGVAVVSQDQVGPFETAVLQANDTATLKEWLTTNGYTVPPAVETLLNPYVEGKYYFLALKLQKDRDAGDLQPISFKYKSTKPGVPIRLTGVAATPDMGVYVWVLGKHRAVPENYRHAEINEARIDWPSGGGNYAAVVTEAMNEAGGQAFVTDYAGKSANIPLGSFDEAAITAFKTKVEQTTDPVKFVRLVLNDGYVLQQAAAAKSAPTGFSGPKRALAFLKRFVPKPAELKDVSDQEFYYGIERFEAEMLAAQQVVDVQKAAAELDDTLVKPAREIRTLFKDLPYLTRLYTTMSPDEMTQDPMFVLNADLPEVSNEHVAKGIRLCSADVEEAWAPVELTLKSGLKFVVSDDRAGLGKPRTAPVKMPAALRVEQLKTAGKASVITNNQAAIQKTLDGVRAASGAIAVDAESGATVSVAVGSGGSGGGATAGAGGFGCMGCANPAKTSDSGKGEGVAFALFALGLAGWRLRAARK